jgi:hypothetical protein
LLLWKTKSPSKRVVKVLTPVYETDFLGFSYGFRPGRNQHQALDALWVGLHWKRVTGCSMQTSRRSLHLKGWRGIATRHTKNLALFLAAAQIRCLAPWL